MPAFEALLGGQQDIIWSYPKPLFQSEAKIVQSHCNKNVFFLLKQMNSLTSLWEHLFFLGQVSSFTRQEKVFLETWAEKTGCSRRLLINIRKVFVLTLVFKVRVCRQISRSDLGGRGRGGGWVQLELTNALTKNESLFYNSLSNFF